MHIEVLAQSYRHETSSGAYMSAEILASHAHPHTHDAHAHTHTHTHNANTHTITYYTHSERVSETEIEGERGE